jgi:L-ascorbate metabolism protein UlaG (beta-lactamase superfamily)
VVFVDPFLSPHEARTWQAPLRPDDMGRQADVILCTHQHLDHFDQPALKAAAATEGAHFRLVVPRPIVEMAVDLGIPRERVIGAQPGEPLGFTEARVHPVPARHGVDVSDAYNFGEQRSHGLVRYLGYVIELGDVRVYHAGDCIPYQGQGDTVGAFHPHLALLPINGRDFYRETEQNLVGNMDFREAARLAVDLGVQALVPMHWELFPHNRGFPGDLVAYVEQFLPRLTVLTFGRSGRFTFVVDQGEEQG